jgi:2,3-bisphosphoglycerate-dependent phosphoglycerate mutase
LWQNFWHNTEALPREVRRDTLDNRGFHITHLYSSLMERSVMTGTAISKAIDVPLEGWLDLHETGGIYLWDEEKEERVGLPGKTPSFFKTRYPEFMLPEEVPHDGWWNRPFELDEEQIPRARRVLNVCWNGMEILKIGWHW